MDIKQALIREHSKATTHAITQYIGSRPERFEILMELYLGDDTVLAQRAAWVFSGVGEVYPHLLLPFLDQLLEQLEQAPHPALQRNFLRVVAEGGVALSEDQEGLLVNSCFELMANPKIPVAIRVHAMQCIANLLEPYPELAIELKPLIEDGLEEGSAGFRSRGKKILKQIHQIEKQLE
ncbi:MAG: hypothetical protein AAFY48_06290 [Bacteroidota bacterium]